MPPVPPPIKPKPLHLTMSIRSKEKSLRRALPDFNNYSTSQFDNANDDNEGGTIKGFNRGIEGGGDDEEADDFGTAKTSPDSTSSELPSLHDLFNSLSTGGGEKKGIDLLELDEPKYDSLVSRRSKGRDVEDKGSFNSTRKRKGGGSSTLKRRKVGGDRNSIFFDPSLENPFFPLSDSSHQSSLALTPTISEELLSSHSVETAVDLELDTSIPLDATVEEDEADEEKDEDESKILDLDTALPAISLHSFSGETAFGELSFEGGIKIFIEVEDLGGGWSLGYLDSEGEESRGLIPKGWYSYIDLPATASKTPVSEVAKVDEKNTSVSPSSSTPIESLLHSSETPSSPSFISSPDPSPSPSSPFISSPPSPRSSSPQRPITPIEYFTIEALPTNLNDSPLSVTASNIRGRSIGRNVVISGIEFEPTDSKAWLSGFGFDDTKEEKEKDSNTLEEEEIREREELDSSRRGLSMFSDEELGGTLGGWKRDKAIDENLNANDLVLEVDPREKLEINVVCDDFDTSRRSSISPVLPISDVVDEEENTDEVEKYLESKEQDVAVKVAEEEPLEARKFSFDPDSVELLSSNQEIDVDEAPTGDSRTLQITEELDTQEAREERWAAIIAQADNPYFPPGDSDSPRNSILEEQEEEEHDSFPAYEDEHVSPHTSSLGSPILHSTLTPSSPPPPSQNSIFSRFGLGTVGRSYSTNTVGFNPSTYTSNIARNKKGKGLVLDWIKNGDAIPEKEEEGEEEGEADDDSPEFHIEAGPNWKTESLPFFVQVHSPETRRSPGTRSEYTSFQITTYVSSTATSSSTDVHQVGVTVERRYSHFNLLHALLVERYPILVFPDLPPKTLSVRFDENFIEIRRRDLERWLNRIGRHDVLRSAEEVRGFLAIEDDGELRRLLSDRDAPSTFFQKVYYPEFNFDHSDVSELADRFERHTKSLEIGGGVNEIDLGIGKVREKLRETSNSLTHLAHSIVRLIAGVALPPTRITDFEEEVNESTSRERAQNLCLQNDEGAFTWKESCDEALSLTKAVQATAESISAVANLYDTNARFSLLPIEELLRESSAPYSQHTELLSNHRAALIHHSDLSEIEISNDSTSAKLFEEEISRCDAIINITSAELERVHKERLEDLKWVAEEYLRTQIELHERALQQLRFAQSHFEPSAYPSLAKTGFRLKSVLERPIPPPSPTLTYPSNFGVPMSITNRPVVEVLNGTVQNLIQIGAASSNLRRSNSKGPPASGGKSVEEILKGQEMEMGIKRVEDGKETWRQTLFGKGSFW